MKLSFMKTSRMTPGIFQGEVCEKNFEPKKSSEEADRLESEEGTILNNKLEFVQPFAIQMRATRMTHR